MKKREDTEGAKNKRVRHLGKFDIQHKNNGMQYRSLWREANMKNEGSEFVSYFVRKGSISYFIYPNTFDCLKCVAELNIELGTSG